MSDPTAETGSDVLILIVQMTDGWRWIAVTTDTHTPLAGGWQPTQHEAVRQAVEQHPRWTIIRTV